MTATCAACLRENREHPFAVPGPPYTRIEKALMDSHIDEKHPETKR